MCCHSIHHPQNCYVTHVQHSSSKFDPQTTQTDMCPQPALKMFPHFPVYPAKYPSSSCSPPLIRNSISLYSESHLILPRSPGILLISQCKHLSCQFNSNSHSTITEVIQVQVGIHVQPSNDISPTHRSYPKIYLHPPFNFSKAN